MFVKKLLFLLLSSHILFAQSYLHCGLCRLRSSCSLPCSRSSHGSRSSRSLSLKMKEDSDAIANNRPVGPTGPSKELLDRRNIMFAYLGINYIFLCENIIPNIEKKQSNIFQKAIPSVCYISTEYTGMADKYNLNKEDLPKGVGTGFVWDKKGHIVTNFHVINKVDNAIITITDKNNVKKNYKAKLTGIDPDLDIAVLKIDIDKSDDLQVITYNKDIKPIIGEYAYAIGNPFGQDHSFTSGIISANNREITAPTGRKIYNVIQTDAAINPGNSGGPLLNSKGELIGINTASLGNGVSSGIGFTIPITNAVKSITDIIDTGYVKKAILGISYMERNPSVLESEKSGIPIISKGLLVLEVPIKSPAYDAGLRGVTRDSKTQKIESIGDIIISINNDEINSPNDLNIILKKYKPNDKVSIEYIRDNINKKTELVLGSYKGTTFTQLENERGKDFSENASNVNIPLKDIEPTIQPRL
jgi:S1-C subfamily serine protease